MNEQARRKLAADAGSFNYSAHPLAGKFPMIEGKAFEDLKADIKQQGILEPIRVYQGMILDGRNRYAAAKACGHIFTPSDFKEWNGSLEEAEAWVISTNFHRRQLTNAQKQEIIQNEIRKYPEKSDREIAKDLNVAHSTVWNAREKLTNSPDAKKYKAFLSAWNKLGPELTAMFVKDQARELRFLLRENDGAFSSNS
jgi:hypothetical protein